ncbi:MAG: hypothetical protein ACRDNS_28540 [Trebonia sp.]
MRESDEAQRRMARNEALFRETNEAIERGQWPGESEKVRRFRCECSNLGCSEAVEVTLGDYEQVRAAPRRFVVAVGHVARDVEDVVATTDRYMVIEKKGAAGQLAEATDPRA